MPTKIADGCYSISGASVKSEGRLYFVGKYLQRIYRWSEAEELTIVRDDTTDSVNLAMDGSGMLSCMLD